jgi:hypothetical protein
VGMMDRIDPVQAAGEHIPAALARVFAAGRSSSGRYAENAQGGGDCKCDESLVSNHGGYLLLSDATPIESRAGSGGGQDGSFVSKSTSAPVQTE